MDVITSKDNQHIKLAAKLTESSSFRRKQGLFVLEGARLCADACESGVEIQEVLYTQQCAEKYAEFLTPCLRAAKKSFMISSEISSRLADTVNPQGIYCVCEALGKSSDPNTIKEDGVYIALENVQDPANLGAICRTAEALGVDGLILSGGCDVYNLKALRASMGALVRMPPLEVENLPELLTSLREKGMQVFACVPDRGARQLDTADFSGGAVAVIGNEGNGITEQTKQASTCAVTIPMLGRAESLNASMAAGIVMWEMLRSRRNSL